MAFETFRDMINLGAREAMIRRRSRIADADRQEASAKALALGRRRSAAQGSRYQGRYAHP